MQTIAQILTYPDKTPIDSFQARLKSVYDYTERPSQYNKTGKTTIQNVILEAGTGETIRAGFWDHPDLKAHEGKEYLFSGGGKKGILVKHGTYKDKPTVELTVNRNGTLQNLMVHTANPEPAKAPNTATPVSSPSRSNLGAPMALNGAKVGMALNNAVLLLTGADRLAELSHDQIMGEVQAWAIAIINLSNDLESGKISLRPPAEAKPAVKEEKGEDVPY